MRLALAFRMASTHHNVASANAHLATDCELTSTISPLAMHPTTVILATIFIFAFYAKAVARAMTTFRESPPG
jgi:hypothetical protein